MWERVLELFGVSIQTGRRLISGLVLLGAFLLAFGGALLLLAALQLQHELNAANGQGVGASIGSVREDVGYLDRADIRQQSDAEAVARITAERSDLDRVENLAIDQMTLADQKVSDAIREQSRSLPSSLVDYYLPPKSEETNQPGYYTLADRYALYSKKLLSLAPQATQFDVHRYIQALDARVAPTLAAFSAARQNYDSAVNKHESLDDQLKSYTQTPPTPPSHLKDAKYRVLIDDFRAYEWVAGSFAFRIVLMPNAMLVLFLAICMGVMGSLIYLAREMVQDGDVRPAPEMLFRIGLGAAVALALYLFAAAGMVAFSQSASAQTQNDMSPYLISFLGITAGYLSDHVTVWMRQVGERTFKLEPEGEERWALVLKTELDRQGLTTDGAAAAIDEDPQVVRQWAELRRAVPAASQAVLAAYVRVPPSRLYTDLDPRVQSATPAAGPQVPAQIAVSKEPAPA